MGGFEGDGVAGDMEVGDVVGVEVDGGAAAGGLAFGVVVEADSRGIVEDEVGFGGADGEEEEKECGSYG